MTYPTTHIWIGYDEREKEAYQVAKYSLEKHATVPIKVHKLCHRELRNQGLFTRKWTVEENGQYTCQVDGKPFSTQFSHTRFLVPQLWRSINDPMKSGLAMFMDSDMLFREDIGLMFQEITTQKYAHNKSHPLYTVHHNYVPDSEVKMDGMKQVRNSKKLWSSLMVWDMEHPDNEVLTPEFVNSEDGAKLHNFNWVQDDKRIGRIDESWNFIPNWSEKNTSKMNNIHWTTGGPNFKNYRNCRYADLWWDAYSEYLASKITKVGFKLEEIIDAE